MPWSPLILLALAAQPDWATDPAVQRRLSAGEVVVESATSPGAADPKSGIRAAVRIAAPAEAVWRIMTDCAEALTFVPGLRRCRLVNRAPDGRWADIEQQVRYSWLLPSVNCVLHAHFDPPHRIDFRRISGDLKEEEGAWVLVETTDRSATVVEYELYLDPGFWVPQFLINRSLRKDLPAALAGLRERVQNPAGGGRK